MEIYPKKEYHNYKIASIEEYSQEVHNGPATRDRIYMIKIMKPTLEYLDKNGIFDSQDFATIFRKFGFRSTDISNFVLFLLKKIQKTDKSITKWIKTRELKKANVQEKNITRLAHEYRSSVYDFMPDFISQTTLSQKLYNEFMAKICKLIENIPINKINNDAVFSINKPIEIHQAEAEAIETSDSYFNYYNEQDDVFFDESLI